MASIRVGKTKENLGFRQIVSRTGTYSEGVQGGQMGRWISREIRSSPHSPKFEKKGVEKGKVGGIERQWGKVGKLAKCGLFSKFGAFSDSGWGGESFRKM